LKDGPGDSYQQASGGWSTVRPCNPSFVRPPQISAAVEPGVVQGNIGHGGGARFGGYRSLRARGFLYGARLPKWKGVVCMSLGWGARLGGGGRRFRRWPGASMTVGRPNDGTTQRVKRARPPPLSAGRRGVVSRPKSEPAVVFTESTRSEQSFPTFTFRVSYGS